MTFCGRQKIVRIRNSLLFTACSELTITIVKVFRQFQVHYMCVHEYSCTIASRVQCNLHMLKWFLLYAENNWKINKI